VTTPPQQPRLGDAERNQILRQVVDSKVIGQQGIYGRVDNVTGRVSMRRTGPGVREWGDTWAEIYTDNWLTHPALVVAHVLVAVCTCGFYLPWWFYRTFKKPPLYRISIDEYGYERWTQHDISLAQKVQRYVVLVVLCWWAWQILKLLALYGNAS